MTAHQVKLFVYRLLHHEVSGTELAALSLRELTDINVYLLERRNVLELRTRNVPDLERFVVGSMIIDKVPQDTYSEQEILSELGMTG